MQTKQQIERLLASAGTGPKHRLGQNFLIDLNLMRLLIEAADIQPDDVVLEVGCGTGSMTEGLAEKAGFVVAVEYDKELAPIAERQLCDSSNVRIVNSDVLEGKHALAAVVLEAVAQARTHYHGRFLLVANLPYNIAAPLMANLVLGPAVVDQMYVTVQQEVAERMTARPGGKDYGPLSIILAVAGTTKILHKLPPSVFWPAPQVYSAMVGFIREPALAGQVRDMKLLSDIVHLFMGYRRKMLKACTKFATGRLSGVENWDSVFAAAEVEPTIRAEMLAPQDYIRLADACLDQLKE
ncbi:MAG: ribosomal RNA small subunit methyltransferase A [Sedimentisphaerales bacterium]|nr:ribosomal RNA small subunit methyltransferase A [Sedimentisphaerales bacterium]